MQGLEHVVGLTATQIKRKLAEHRISHKKIEHNQQHPKGPYFLDTALTVNIPTKRVIDAIGMNPLTIHTAKPGCVYFAFHKVSTLLDLSKLHGVITFNQGNLVERTRIYTK